MPLAPRTARAIRLYIGERTTGPIFLGSYGERMDRHAADRAVKRIARRAGIAKKISPHSLRHSFITAALDAEVTLRDVQDATSHADPRTTMRYDRARHSLDRHATYVVATFVATAPLTAELRHIIERSFPSGPGAAKRRLPSAAGRDFGAVILSGTLDAGGHESLRRLVAARRSLRPVEVR